jgi:hypothetical protein
LDIAEAVSVTVNRPTWGYETEIHMPIAITRAADGTYGFFDPLNAAGTTLGTYDYRVMSSSLWRMTNAQKTAFNAFMLDAAKGRALNMVMRLSAEGVFTGFYPFGVDMCDNGDYTVRELTRDQSGKMMRPLKWYEDNMSLVMVTRGGVSFSAPAASQGKLYIGDIATGFMFPQSGIKPVSSYQFQTDLSLSGAPNSLNGPAVADSWETSFDLLCNTQNTYALIDQLVNKTRAADLTLVVPDHFDMFGADQSANGAGGTYTARFLGSSRTDKEVVLKITHEGFDRFKIPLTFWMKAKTA